MPSAAVFVDAGYLFAQGSTALTGSKKPRINTRLNETAVMAELRAAVTVKCPGCDLLRVYWYDGAFSSRGLSLEHSTLAHMDYIKLRLGFVSGRGQQKGVDSLIVTDLIDLARNRAITDAVVLSGDEDIRIGVQIAQSLGVRVHLIGIIPSRGSQSLQLLRESDTTTEWDVPTVAKFLSVRAPAATIAVPTPASTTAAAAPVTAGSGGLPSITPHDAAKIDAVALALQQSLDSTEVTTLKTHWTAAKDVPREYDGRLLARSRDEIGRSLDAAEKRYARAKFIEIVKAS